MENCIFCKIIKGELPCKKIFENEEIMVFLDINPAIQGHLLVIPKKHFVNVADTPENTLREVVAVSKKMGLLLKEKLLAEGFNIINASGEEAQQSVFHLHFHVVPRYKNDGCILPKS